MNSQIINKIMCFMVDNISDKYRYYIEKIGKDKKDNE